MLDEVFVAGKKAGPRERPGAGLGVTVRSADPGSSFARMLLSRLARGENG